jgi:hypothetical protein
MNEVIPIAMSQGQNQDLAERFWAIARVMDMPGRDQSDPVSVVRHVLAVLDALDRGESGADLSVQTLSFLKLLRESENQGDFAYASPEQVRGESLDERSLVFSVGVLLFERLTGRHPFGAEGNSPRRAARIGRGELGSGVNYFPTVPAGLRSVLMRAMGPFPEERFSSLAELRARLEQFIHDQAPAPRLPGTAPSGERTMIVRAPTAFARDLVAAADAHNVNVKGRRRRQSSTPSPLGLARVDPEPARMDPEPARMDPEPARVDPEPARMDPEPARPVATRERNTAGLDSDRARAIRETHLVAASAEPAAARPARPARDVSPGAAPMPGTQRHAAHEPRAQGDHDDDNAILRATTTLLPARQARQGHAADQRAMATEALRPARNPLVGKLIWLGLGAGLAVAIMTVIGLVMWPRGSAPTASAEPPPPAAEPEQPALIVVDEPEPEPAVFDRELGGRQAVELARTCFSPAQLGAGVRFRASLRYPAGEGGVTRVYFAPTHEIAATERVCVREKLLGMIAGAPPESVLIVEYQLHLTSTGGEAVIK